MKFSSVLFSLFFLLAASANAQHLSVEIQAGRFYPSLTGLKGEIPNCQYTAYHSDFPDVSVEYTKSSGLLFAATIGYQRDWFVFSERVPMPTFGGPLAFAKIYKSFPFILSSGYKYDIGKSRFHFIGKAGIGFGMVHSNDVSKDYFFEVGHMQVFGKDGQMHDDSEHVKIVIIDHSIKKFLPQVRASVALEYQAKHFFVRAFLEARSWLGGFGEIDYHSENSSTYAQYSQVSDGHFSLRMGYIGAGAGIGWCFQ